MKQFSTARPITVCAARIHSLQISLFGGMDRRVKPGDDGGDAPIWPSCAGLTRRSIFPRESIPALRMAEGGVR
jgi:hypothetical protein